MIKIFFTMKNIVLHDFKKFAITFKKSAIVLMTSLYHKIKDEVFNFSIFLF